MKRGQVVLVLLALSGRAGAAGDPAQAWLRGVLGQLGRGQVTAVLDALDERLRTPEWRARLSALRGLQVTQLAPQGAQRYALYYRVPQGALSLVGGATLSVQAAPGRAGGYQITAWERREAPRLDAVPSVLAPGTPLALRGDGFPAKAPVTLRLGLPGTEAVVLGRVQASVGGSFSLTGVVPAELAAAPPDATSLQLSADGPGGPLVSLSLPFRPPNAPGELDARYQGAGFSLRYPGRYRSLQSATSLSLVAPSGQLALRLNLLERAGEPTSDPDADAALLAAQYPQVLPASDAAPLPLPDPLPGWTLALTGDRTAAVLSDPSGARWALLVAEPGFSSLLAPLARTLSFEAPPVAQPLDGP